MLSLAGKTFRNSDSDLSREKELICRYLYIIYLEVPVRTDLLPYSIWAILPSEFHSSYMLYLCNQ